MGNLCRTAKASAASGQSRAKASAASVCEPVTCGVKGGGVKGGGVKGGGVQSGGVKGGGVNGVKGGGVTTESRKLGWLASAMLRDRGRTSQQQEDKHNRESK